MRIRRLIFALPISLCLSGPVLAQASASQFSASQFSAEAEAKASCPAGSVVWVNKQSKVIHAPGSQHYGKTKSGAYMCRQPAEAAGFHAPPARTTAAKPAAPSSTAPSSTTTTR